MISSCFPNLNLRLNYTLLAHHHGYEPCHLSNMILMSPYAQRHKELAEKNPEYSFGHKLIYWIEACPIIGHAASLAEVITVFVIRLFINVTHPTRAAKPKEILEVKPIEIEPETLKALESKVDVPKMKTLMDHYRSFWDSEKRKFNKIPFINDDFIHLANEYTSKIKINLPRPFNHNPDIDDIPDAGYIEKKELPEGTRIFVRADLHGDLKSLMENLDNLQKEGLLDHNYRCQEKVHLVFLGDFVDRSDHSLEVLSLLMLLKLENKDQVTLIRGNHEESGTLFKWKLDQNLTTFKNHPSFSQILNAIFSTFPLTVYLSQKGEFKEYVQFTHALFPFYVNPKKFLENPQVPFDIVPNGADQEILKAELKNIQTSSGLEASEVQSLNPGDLKANDKQKYRNLKLYEAAENIIKLIQDDSSIGDREFSPYNWGDVSPNDKSITGRLSNRSWRISPKMIVSHFRINQSSHHKIKFIFRGHEHHHIFHKQNEKLIGTTLPTGNKAYILKIAPKVKDWKKRALSREQGDKITPTSQEFPLRSTEV